MQEYTNSQEALAAVEQNKTFVIANLNDFDEVAHKNVHNCYELFYAQSSGGKLLIDNRNYLVERGSLFFINDFESHFFTAEKTNMYQRKVLYIHPPFLRRLSTPQTDLTQCFQRDGGEQFSHKVLLSKSQQSQVNQLLQRLSSTSTGYGQDIMEQSVFCELMVLLNQLFTQSMEESQQPAASNDTNLVDDIIKYINENITDRLQISIIAAHFYLSDAYVCRAFKAQTGTTINKYITARRITIAKQYLAKGSTVLNACEKSGFRDYTNFVKAFTKLVGISPKKYEKLHAQERAPKKRA